MEYLKRYHEYLDIVFGQDIAKDTKFKKEWIHNPGNIVKIW